MTEQTSRAALRKATLGTKKNFRKKIVEFNDEKFEIRQPSIRNRGELRKKCSTISETGGIEFDMFEFLVWVVIQNTYVPGTNERVFSEEDYDALVDNPTGGFMDEFAEIATDLANINVDDKKKSSTKITKDDSSSSSQKQSAA